MNVNHERRDLNDDGLRRFGVEEDRNREAMKLAVRRLGYDLVDDLAVGIFANPTGHDFAEILAFPCLGC